MIQIIKGDLCDQDADVIVNSANDSLILGSGVASQIRRRGGEMVQHVCNKYRERFGKCLLGSAILTDGGNLPQHIIHAIVKPIGGRVTYSSIINATKASIDLAILQGFNSIAFPAFGTGSGKIPYMVSAHTMKAGFKKSGIFLEENNSNNTSISLILPDDEAVRIFEKVFYGIRDV